MREIKKPYYYKSSTDAHASICFVSAEEKDAFEKECSALLEKHQITIINKYGYFAPNQGQFVESLDKFNEFDSPSYIPQWIWENRYA